MTALIGQTKLSKNVSLEANVLFTCMTAHNKKVLVNIWHTAKKHVLSLAHGVLKMIHPTWQYRWSPVVVLISLFHFVSVCFSVPLPKILKCFNFVQIIFENLNSS